MPIIILVVLGLLVAINADLCQRPHVQSKIVYIYRLRDSKTITVYNCFHIKSATMAYSDITDRCIQSLKSGFFVDKFNTTNTLVKHRSTQGYIMSYSAKANRVENKVLLRSGTICNYDRGFCYDSKENNNYAAVWDIDVTPGTVTGDLIYHGNADIWSFKNNSLHYLFRETRNKNEAFSFQLLKASKMRDITFWYTEKKFIVADGPLFGVKLSPVDFKELEMGTKSQVTEAILKSCDIQSLEFTHSLLPVSEEYFTDPNNLKTILRTYGQTISTTNQQVTEIKTKNEVSKKIEKSVLNLEIALKKKDEDIKKLQSNVIILNKTLLNYNSTFAKSQKKSIDSDSRDIESLKNKLNNDFKLYKNELNSITDKLSQHEIKNSNISENLEQLNNVLLDLSKKHVKMDETLSNMQSQVNVSNFQKEILDSTAKTAETIKNNFDTLSEKYNSILKLIEKNKNENIIMDKKLATLNRTIFDANSTESLYNYYITLDNKMENNIKTLHTLITNNEEIHSHELEKNLQDKIERLIDKYDLQLIRSNDNERLISKLKKELEIINRNVTDMHQNNVHYNNSLLNLELMISEKISMFNNKYNDDLTNLIDMNNDTLTTINKTFNAKYKEVLAYLDSKNKLDKLYNIENLETIKNLSLSQNHDHEQIEIIISNIKNLDTINKSVDINTLKIEKLYAHIKTENENLQLLNLTLTQISKENKDFEQKLNNINKMQSDSINTIKNNDNNIKVIKDELNEAVQSIDKNTEAISISKNQCNECTIERFKILEEELIELQNSLLKKDEDISGCRSEINFLSKKHDGEIAEISKKHDEDIKKVREEINNLREEIMETFIPPN